MFLCYYFEYNMLQLCTKIPQIYTTIYYYCTLLYTTILYYNILHLGILIHYHFIHTYYTAIHYNI